MFFNLTLTLHVYSDEKLPSGNSGTISTTVTLSIYPNRLVHRCMICIFHIWLCAVFIVINEYSQSYKCVVQSANLLNSIRDYQDRNCCHVWQHDSYDRDSSYRNQLLKWGSCHKLACQAACRENRSFEPRFEVIFINVIPAVNLLVEVDLIHFSLQSSEGVWNDKLGSCVWVWIWWVRDKKGLANLSAISLNKLKVNK